MTDKKKIVILGGGVSAMTTAYYLTNQPNWNEYFDLTIYQMGWRLGGKGASGRNPNKHQRIEEHGLHVWGGFYENAFATMRDCYDKADRPEHVPLSTWRDAFKAQSFVTWEEEVEPGVWSHWPINFPENSDEPGDGTELPSLWAYIETFLGWIRNAFIHFPLHHIMQQSREQVGADQGSDLIPDWLERLVGLADRVVGKVFDGSPFWMLQEAILITQSILAQPGANLAADELKLVDYLSAFLNWLRDNFEDEIWAHDGARRAYIFIALGITVVRGMIVDGVLVDGFPTIDEYDLKAWLARHGASDKIVNSTPVWAYYDYFFAYEDGDTDKPIMTAGMGLNHLLRLIAGYKGAIFWEMQAGMGDAVFAPMYEVMKRRGVKFEFFHMVEGLHTDPEDRLIDRVTIAKQVNLKGGGEYEPLVNVKDLPCWPSYPLWDQIEDGQALKDSGVNFEDRYSDWTPAEMIELKKGEDFDYLVLGISIGEFQYICKELIDQNPDWYIMCDQLQTVQTIALQLWFRPNATELGWEMPKTVMTGYAQPIETWADMSQVIDREDWPAALKPGNIAYYCGPLKNPPALPTGKDPDFGKQQTAIARQTALDWLADNLHHLFPDATVPGHPDEVDWSLLIDQNDGTGLERFDAQYVRANYTPTERYVISRPGTNRFRMTSNTSGYTNLVLAGDWLYTGLGGSVEGAVVAGMQASRTLVSYPHRIIGEPEHNPWARAVSVEPFVDLSHLRDG